MSQQGATGPEWVFYDGGCGLCHRAVRFFLARDRDGSAFRFAPIGGERFSQLVGPAERATLPDSIVVRTGEGRLLVRSGAIRHLLFRLGGLWGVGSRLMALVPRRLADRMYDLVAGSRKRLFAAPAEACPLVPRELRARFDA